MKNIILTFCFALAAGLAVGQVKVITNGNVGIGGVSNPAFPLTVDGNIVTNNNIFVGEGTTNANLFMKLGRNRTANGSVGIDMIGDVSNFPAYGFRFLRNGAGQTILTHRGTQLFRVACEQASLLQFFTSNQPRLMVVASGNVAVGGQSAAQKLHVFGNVQATDFIVASDKRLKTDIQKFDMGLDKLLEIQPYTYMYNGKARIDSKETHYGVIAQEFEKILPDAVNDFTYEDLDDDGKVIETENYKAVQTESIKFILVNAVKEQQAIIEEQNERINRLEELVQTLVDGQKQTIDISGNDKSKAVLGNNYPNPFESNTKINYFVPSEATSAKINLFDMTGKLIKTVDINNTGNGVLDVNISEMPSGIYNYQMIVNDRIVDTKKMKIAK